MVRFPPPAGRIQFARQPESFLDDSLIDRTGLDGVFDLAADA
jgi:hypothetical protein